MKLLIDDWEAVLVTLKREASTRLYEAAMSGDGGDLDTCLIECERLKAAEHHAQQLGRLTGQWRAPTEQAE